MTLTLPGAVTSTLEEGRQAYVAVPSRNGPHVTPELYAWYAGRLWFASATTTLKSKVLDRDPTTGVLVTVAGRSVLLTGRTEIFDPRAPAALARRATDLPDATQALVRYTVRNASDLMAFVGDTVTGRLGRRLPPIRLLFALDPSAAAFVENDALTDCWGWSCDDSVDDRAVPVGGQPAVAALPGPVAVPARWFADDARLHVTPGLLRMFELPESFPISVVLDAYTAPGPAAKHGTLVRGTGLRVAEALGFLQVEADTTVEWAGVATRRQHRRP